MSRTPNREHDRLRAMIERMQRDGVPERAIHEAVRRAVSEAHPERKPGLAHVRRVRRFALFGRRADR
jgi:hypothetical protein